MASQHSISRQTLSSKRAQGFFKLPRELRDEIYDLLVKDFEEKAETASEPILKKRVQIVRLRLINSQFKDEYDEHFLRVERLGELVVNDLGSPRPATAPFPRFAHNTTNMTLSLAGCRCDCGRAGVDRTTRLGEHREWIDRLAKDMPHLRSIRVIIIIPWLRCKKHILRSLEIMTGMPTLAKLELRPRPFVYPFYDGENAPTLATWTREQGLVQNREVIREFRSKGANARWFPIPRW